MLSVAEEGGTVQVCATLTTPHSIGGDVTVTLATSDDTGTMLKHSTVHSQCVNHYLQPLLGLTMCWCLRMWSSLLVPAMVVFSV